MNGGHLRFSSSVEDFVYFNGIEMQKCVCTILFLEIYNNYIILSLSE